MLASVAKSSAHSITPTVLDLLSTYLSTPASVPSQAAIKDTLLLISECLTLVLGMEAPTHREDHLLILKNS